MNIDNKMQGVENANISLLFLVDKLNLHEYIDKNDFPDREKQMDKLAEISAKDELIVIKYLLSIMKKHDILNEEECKTVQYKCDKGG